MQFRFVAVFTIAFLTLGLSACEHEVGSNGWCKQITEKPKSERTAEEFITYADKCIK